MPSSNLSDEEDEIIAKVKEESLKYYKDFELPRIQSTPSTSKKSQAKDLTPATSKTPSVIVSKPLTSKEGNDGICRPAFSQENSRPIWYEGNEAEGFYIAAGNTFIYPTNYPVRKYQEQIVETSLFKNTLVSLPTGLGKTFIAAVVMYNFYRWYPNGKIIFMAPTKPLVAQQIRACYNIMNLPLSDTVEMTGSLGVQDRQELWKEKRVFFLTPHILVNDLQSGTCCAQLIKCLVVDEAHKAVKDYAYCQAVKLLEQNKVVYRLLALSATPGNDVVGVQQVITNLKITDLEFRGEDAPDVVPYTHSRSVESVPVELSVSIQRVKGDFLKVYEKYAKRLRETKVMSLNIATISKFQILKACEKFRARPPNGMPQSLVGSLMSDFAVCMSLAHALELLQIYGLRAFYTCIKEGGGEKSKAAITRIKNDSDLAKVLERLNDLLSVKPGNDKYLWGHPKLFKMVKIITEHFSDCEKKGENSKVIVFCQYRVVVNEVLELLVSLNMPHVRPVMFVGQSNGKDKGMNQARQIQIMKEFRSGVYNCLVATCVAEEGLDIGEVDLIILMEAHKSPIRLVQRIGRTGRKRSGKCIVLLTKGKEESRFQEAMAARKSYVSNILSSKGVKASLCVNNPHMFPPGVKPEKLYLHIKVNERFTPLKPVTSKQSDIRKALVVEELPFLEPTEYVEVVKELKKSTLDFGKLPNRIEMFPNFYNERMPVEDLLKKDVNKLSEWKDWNLELHENYEISHSEKSKLLITLYNRYRFSSNSFLKPSGGGSRKKNKLESDEEVTPSKEQKIKKVKKETAKNKFGMDIRHCMAAAAGRKKEKESNNEDCIIIELDDSLGDDEKVYNAQLVDDIIIQLDSALNKINKSMGVSKKMLCPFSKEVSKGLDLFIVETAEKTKNVWSERPEISNVDTFFDNLLPGMIQLKNPVCIISETEMANREYQEENYFGNKTPDKNESGLSFLPTPLFDSGNKKTDVNKSNQMIDSVDDVLFNNIDISALELSGEKKETSKSDNSNDENSNDFVSLDDLFDDADKLTVPQASTSNKQLSVPAVQNKINIRNHSNEKSLPSVPEKNLKPSSLLFQGQQNLVSSTPKAKVCLFTEKNKNEISNSVQMQEENRKECELDLWNVSDLFEDDFSVDEIEAKKIENALDKSTMIGITQMVSMIEEEKRIKLAKGSNSKDSSSDNDSGTSKSFVHHEFQHDDGIKQNKAFEMSLLDEDDDIFSCVVEPAVTKDSLEPEDKAVVKSIDSIGVESIKSKFNNESNCTSNSSSSKEPVVENTISNFKKFNLNKKKVSSTQPCIKLVPEENPTIKVLPKKKVGLSLKVKPNLPKVNNNDDPSQLIINKPVKDDSCCFDFPIPGSKEESVLDTPSNGDSLIGRGILTNIQDSMKEGSSSLEKSKSISKSHFSIDDNKSRNNSDKKSSFEEYGSLFGLDDDDIFEIDKQCPSVKTTENHKRKSVEEKKRIKKKQRKNHQECEFIDAEAEESGSSNDSDEVSSSGLDDMDESFIDDENNHSVDMKAKYLQSVRSPLVGKFKIPVNKPRVSNVYSQFEENDTEYMNDSFCVDGEESTSSSELSELELAEKKLSRKRRKKQSHRKEGKRRKSLGDENNSIVNGVNKNIAIKKNFVIISDSESDVTPKDKRMPIKKKPRLNISSDGSSLEKKAVPSSSSSHFSSRKSLFTNDVGRQNEDDDHEFEMAILASQNEFMRTLENCEKEKQDLEEALRLSKLNPIVDKAQMSQEYEKEKVNFSNLSKVVNRKKFVKTKKPSSVIIIDSD